VKNIDFNRVPLKEGGEGFSGSYLEDDVTFLLKVIDIPDTDIEEKERLIQSGKSHYSEMISKEYQPSKEYLDIFYQSFELNLERFAQDILNLLMLFLTVEI